MLFRSAEAEDAVNTWQYDSLSGHVMIMMAHIIVDVTERLIDWKHPEHVAPKDVENELMYMIDRLDELLHFLPQEADVVYHRLLHRLRIQKANNTLESVARKHILSGIWGHIAAFTFKGQLRWSMFVCVFLMHLQMSITSRTCSMKHMKKRRITT